MPETEQSSDVTALTVQLLSAYLANNSVASAELADLIRTTRAALTGEAEAEAPAAAETFTPAVSVRKSLASSEHIISLIDGKPYKTLKRHLASHGLTPETYRSRYNLPASYPMVAPDYAAHRRAVAQKVGLGTRKPAAAGTEPAELLADADPSIEADVPEATPQPQPETAKAPAKKASRRGAKKAAEASSSEPVDTAEVPSTDEAGAPADAQATAKPARRKTGQPSKRAGKATKASKAEAGDEDSATADEPAQAAPTDVAPDDAAPASAAPKRRGRLGLFKADEAEADTPSDAKPEENEEPAANEGEPAKGSSKPKKRAPRMAREPGKREAASKASSS